MDTVDITDMNNSDSYWSAIEPVWDEISIYDGEEEFLRAFDVAPLVPRNLFAAHWCQSEICNGGLHQFFGNATGVLAPEAVVAFDVLEMPRVASTLKQAMCWFGASYPRERMARVSALSAYVERHPGQWNPFDTLDNSFFEAIGTENGGFECAANAYVALHRN
jgi:hypothetical protein